MDSNFNLFDLLAGKLNLGSEALKEPVTLRGDPMTQIRLIAYVLAVALNIPAPREGLEHSQPYALCRHRLSGPSAREPADDRQGKSSAGQTFLVRKPMASEASRCSCH
jgi:hypothetical protein